MEFDASEIVLAQAQVPVLAQVLPQSATDYLIGQGFLGIAVLALAGVLLWIFKALQASWEARIADAEKLRTTLEANSLVKQTLVAEMQSRTRSTEELTREVRALTERMVDVERKLDLRERGGRGV